METPAARRRTMQAVKNKDTGPELAVRKLLREIGAGYRLHRSDLPGKPDITMAGRRKIIFVHGCFWHGHDCPRGARAPKANADYWSVKIERNRARDAKSRQALEDQGWSVLIVWECETRNQDQLASLLRKFTGEPSSESDNTHYGTTF